MEARVLMKQMTNTRRNDATKDPEFPKQQIEILCPPTRPFYVFTHVPSRTPEMMEGDVVLGVLQRCDTGQTKGAMRCVAEWISTSGNGGD